MFKIYNLSLAFSSASDPTPCDDVSWIANPGSPWAR